MGLDFLLKISEAVEMSRRLGSVPTIFPLLHGRFPQELIYFKNPRGNLARPSKLLLVSKMEEEQFCSFLFWEGMIWGTVLKISI